MADIASNEPGLSSALEVLAPLVARVEAGRRSARSRIVLLGFSQGACLASEFAVRHAARFGGVVVFSGGAIGPPGTHLGRLGPLRRHADLLRVQRPRRARAGVARHRERGSLASNMKN